MPPEKLSWKHLYDEVVTSGLCTGCAGCVIACPHDVLSYKDTEGTYKPFQIEDYGGPADCSHGDKNCTSCTRACPRFRDWEPDVDEFLFGRKREAEELSGIYKDIVLAKASDPVLHEVGQDGGLVSAILLYCLEKDIIDAALVSYLEGDGSTWKAIPGVAKTKEDIIASAGSRYTYSANPMAYAEAVEGGAERIALVGMSCQSSMPPVMKQRKAGKVARRMSLNIGLLCSKTFDDAIFEELFEAKYGLHKKDIKKMNIKGVFQIWMHNGDYHEVPAQGVPRLDPRGLQVLPGLRGRARRHLDRRHRRVQRLDAHHRPHRPRAARSWRASRTRGGSTCAPATTTPMRSSSCTSSRSAPASGGRSSPSPSPGSSARKPQPQALRPQREVPRCPNRTRTC